MIFELIAVFVAGFAGAGVALILGKLSGRLLGAALPRWLMPVMAGAAMLGMAIWNEYDWFPRSRAALPEGVVVAATVEERAAWRPWTLVFPFTSRFIAVDRGAVRQLGADPVLAVTSIYAFARWQPTRAIHVAVDCAGGRRADLTGAAQLGPEGVTGATFREMGAGDPVIATVCGDGA